MIPSPQNSRWRPKTGSIFILVRMVVCERGCRACRAGRRGCHEDATKKLLPWNSSSSSMIQDRVERQRALHQLVIATNCRTRRTLRSRVYKYRQMRRKTFNLVTNDRNGNRLPRHRPSALPSPRGHPSPRVWSVELRPTWSCWPRSLCVFKHPLSN